MQHFVQDGGKDDSYIYFDGGPVGRGHQHEDKLSLTLFANGKQIITEGNNYAYDDSEMRKYVRSTRSHNTIRIDGKDQNRRENYKWEIGEIKKKSDMTFNFTDEVDAVSSFYNEGYGEEQEKLATHKRNVYFIKKMKDLNPFVIVVDRLTSDEEHEYEVMWHFDAENFIQNRLNVKADNLTVIVPENIAELKIFHGEETPYFQGWTADSVVQGDFRPVYNASYFINAKDVKWVTVLCINPGEKRGIKKVVSNNTVNDTEIILILDNGEKIVIDEKNYLK